ncbi:MAG: hypothetical protein HQM14_21195 [SAR324 cluster bacterium]|nr:hypothetical protein [SAR324 cluster bacterium]
MEHISTHSTKLSVKELKDHPEILVDLITGEEQDISLSVSKHGSEIVINRKVYDPDFASTVERAKQLAEQKLQKGYTREQAGRRFLQLQDKISSEIKD